MISPKKFHMNIAVFFCAGSVPEVVALFNKKTGGLLYGKYCSHYDLCKRKAVYKPNTLFTQISVGSTLAGAGGGGFMIAIVKDPVMKEKVHEIVTNTVELSNFVIYKASIDVQGLQIQM